MMMSVLAVVSPGMQVLGRMTGKPTDHDSYQVIALVYEHNNTNSL